jgi:hypothetical protein
MGWSTLRGLPVNGSDSDNCCLRQSATGQSRFSKGSHSANALSLTYLSGAINPNESNRPIFALASSIR